MRYFSKIDPGQPLLSGSGSWIAFQDFKNGMGGIATENPHIIKEFLSAIAESRGGLQEVTAAEFEELKKKAPSFKSFKEELSGSQYRELIARRDAVRAGGKLAVGKRGNGLVSFLAASHVSGRDIPTYRPTSVRR